MKEPWFSKGTLKLILYNSIYFVIFAAVYYYTLMELFIQIY